MASRHAKTGCHVIVSSFVTASFVRGRAQVERGLDRPARVGRPGDGTERRDETAVPHMRCDAARKVTSLVHTRYLCLNALFATHGRASP